MSQALRNATESLANGLYGAPFFFSFSPPTPLFAAHCSLFLFGPRSRAKSRSSLLTERSFQLFFTFRPLRPHWASSPHGGNVLPRSNYTRGPLSVSVVQLVVLGARLCASVRACDQVVGDT